MVPLPRNNISRNIDFATIGCAPLSHGVALACPSRCHRPQNPERAAGRRPNDQCGTRQPGRHFAAALPAAGARAGRGRLHQGLSRAARREKLGYEVAVFAMVHLSSQAEADLSAFEDFVRAQPLVRECWMLSGEIDFVLKCVAPDMEDLSGLRREAHFRAQRAQREDLAHAAQVQRRGHGADGRVGEGLAACRVSGARQRPNCAPFRVRCCASPRNDVS